MMSNKITIKIFKDPNIFKDSTQVCPEWGSTCESQCVHWHGYWLCGKDIEQQIERQIEQQNNNDTVNKLYEEYQKILADNK